MIQKGIYYDLLIDYETPEITTIKRDLIKKVMPETVEMLYLLIEYPDELSLWIEASYNCRKKKQTTCIINKRNFKRFLRYIYSGKCLGIYDELALLISTIKR